MAYFVGWMTPFPAIRHAGARTARLLLVCREGRISLAAEDDCTGPQPAGAAGTGAAGGAGNGLANIRSRLTTLQGTFDMSDIAPGTRLHVTFASG